MKRLRRLIRRLAAYVLMKSGPIALYVRPRCGQCGHQFEVRVQDLTPTILTTVSHHDRPGLSVVPVGPGPAVFQQPEGPNDLRN